METKGQSRRSPEPGGAGKEGKMRKHLGISDFGFRIWYLVFGILQSAIRNFRVGALLLGLVLAGGRAKGDVSGPQGHTTSETDLTIAVWFGGFDYLPDGRLIVSDSEDVFILDEEGTGTAVAHFEMEGLFGSFVKVAPDGETVYVGESSVGTISGFDLNVGGIQPIGPGTEAVLAEVPLNYDLEFDPRGRAFVSAATPETWQPNRLLFLDTESGETHLVAVVQGYSGPLAFDGEGNLFYCTSTCYPPEAVESVIIFRRDQIDGAVVGNHLTNDDAETYVSGIYGFSDMVFDSDGDLFGVTGSGAVVELSEGEGNVVTRAFASVSPNGATAVRFLAGTRAFEPYYQDGGTLTFLESDFWSLFRLVHVTPSPEFRVISVRPSPEGMTVAFATEAGKRYQVYWCGGLTNSPGWQTLGDAVSGEGKPMLVLDTGDEQAGRPAPDLTSVRRRFYKVGTVQ